MLLLLPFSSNLKSLIAQSLQSPASTGPPSTPPGSRVTVATPLLCVFASPSTVGFSLHRRCTASGGFQVLPSFASLLDCL
ncbi:uncharacterized protein DS421_9g257600 [Arachis hypogaea]|nr:uncharacterized protein DS421_9g257600 [Arachis hypogaea]